MDRTLTFAATTGVAAAASACLLLRAAWGIPFRWLGARALVRQAFGAFVLAFVATAIAIPAIATFGVQLARAHGHGAMVGYGTALAFASLVSFRRRHERAALRLIERLPDSTSPAWEHRALAGKLGLLRRRKDATHRVAALEVASVRALRLAGLRGPARELAEAIEPSSLEPELREAWRYDNAVLRIRDGAYEAAEELLGADASCPSLVLRAWTHALQGGADQALALLARAEPREPETRMLADVARGHALASMDRDDEARRILGTIVAEHGLGALANALRPVGPATDLARALVGRDLRTSSVPPLPPPPG